MLDPLHFDHELMNTSGGIAMLAGDPSIADDGEWSVGHTDGMKVEWRAGYTLLELLIAISLTAILMVAMFTAMNIYFRLQLDSYEEITRQQISRALLRQMTRDIQSVVFVKEKTEDDNSGASSYWTSSGRRGAAGGSGSTGGNNSTRTPKSTGILNSSIGSGESDATTGSPSNSVPVNRSVAASADLIDEESAKSRDPPKTRSDFSGAGRAVLEANRTPSSSDRTNRFVPANRSVAASADFIDRKSATSQAASTMDSNSSRGSGGTITAGGADPSGKFVQPENRGATLASGTDSNSRTVGGDFKTETLAYKGGIVGTTTDLMLYVSCPDRKLSYRHTESLELSNDRTSDLMIVRYVVAGAETGARGLIRITGDPYGARNTKQSVELGNVISAEAIDAKEVSHVEFQYYDGGNWQDSWDSATQNCLPVAIEIVLTLRPPDTGGDQLSAEKSEPFALGATRHRIVVALPIAER